MVKRTFEREAAPASAFEEGMIRFDARYPYLPVWQRRDDGNTFLVIGDAVERELARRVRQLETTLRVTLGGFRDHSRIAHARLELTSLKELVRGYKRSVESLIKYQKKGVQIISRVTTNGPIVGLSEKIERLRGAPEEGSPHDRLSQALALVSSLFVQAADSCNQYSEQITFDSVDVRQRTAAQRKGDDVPTEYLASEWIAMGAKALVLASEVDELRVELLRGGRQVIVVDEIALSTSSANSDIPPDKRRDVH